MFCPKNLAQLLHASLLAFRSAERIKDLVADPSGHPSAARGCASRFPKRTGSQDAIREGAGALCLQRRDSSCYQFDCPSLHQAQGAAARKLTATSSSAPPATNTGTN